VWVRNPPIPLNSQLCAAGCTFHKTLSGTYLSRGPRFMATDVAMKKLKSPCGYAYRGKSVAIMLVLPNVAQADEQQAMPRVVGWSVTLDVPGFGELSVPEKAIKNSRFAQI